MARRRRASFRGSIERGQSAVSDRAYNAASASSAAIPVRGGPPKKSAGRKRLEHMRRRGRLNLDRRLRLRERHDDLAREQLKGKLGARTVNRIAEDRPALSRAMDPELVGASRLRLKFEPGDRRAAPNTAALDLPEVSAFC